MHYKVAPPPLSIAILVSDPTPHGWKPWDSFVPAKTGPKCQTETVVWHCYANANANAKTSLSAPGTVYINCMRVRLPKETFPPGLAN